MDRNWYLRFTVVVATIVVAWLALWPSLGRLDENGRLAHGSVLPANLVAPEWVRETFRGRISPGLDIRGGLRLMYEVEVDGYVEEERNRVAERILREVGVALRALTDDEAENPPAEKLARLRERVTVRKVGASSIRLVFRDAADASKIDRDWVREHHDDFRIDASREGDEAKEVFLTYRDARIDEMRTTAVQQAVLTIERRIDSLGLREASVSGRDRDIIVEVPGADERTFENIRSIISRTARLEFKIVDEGQATWMPGPEVQLPAGVTRSGNNLLAEGDAGRDALEQLIRTFTVPDDHVLAVGDTGESGRTTRYTVFYLLDATDVTGDDIDSAQVQFNDQEANRPVVGIQFKGPGATDFEELTGRNVGKKMAIVLDDRVMSAPVIQERIGGGRAQITLGNSFGQNLMDEANNLVVVLKSGALPARLRPSNEQMLGPTLGPAAVAQATKGAVIGIGIILIFMLVYYQFAGFVADIMVLVNLLMQLAIMAMFEATLTLPGIAATALTVGMSIDANVLITERIREELRAGRTARAAVDQGFDRAFWSIFDGQITTLIAGLVLFQFGTGPIKGFSVMLMIGMITSLFTGIFCSKVVLDWYVRGLKRQHIPVG